jgi:hypothetical protein
MTICNIKLVHQNIDIIPNLLRIYFPHPRLLFSHPVSFRLTVHSSPRSQADVLPFKAAMRKP